MLLYAMFLAGLAFLVFLIWHMVSEEGKAHRWTGVGATLAALVVCGLSLYPLNESIRLGLDLKGGMAYVIELEGQPSASALDQAVNVIRKRVDKYGLSEPIIQPTGANRISVQIPGLSKEEQERTKNQLSQVAKLEFRLVHKDNESLLSKMATDKAPIGYEYLYRIDRDPKGKEIARFPIVVNRRAELSGKHVQRAFRGFDEIGRPTVVIQFHDAGKKLFGDLTAANIGSQLAIVLDGEVMSAPVINGAIYDNATISGGNMGAVEAENLASVLENPLETPVKIVEERGVDPSLGRDSIQSGTKAGLIALAGVVAFMVIYYRLAGVISVIALTVNLLLLLGLLAQFQFTLTLPGIAGIILTIGMAVDANVLIYERIRDELNLGKPLRASIHAGFDRAFSAIVDSNITTIIPAAILIFLGSGPLQGFAVTLTLGILANLFAALVVSRNAFEWLLAFDGIHTIKMMQFLKNPKYDFLSARWVAVAISGVILLAGAGLLTKQGTNALGVDFVGGEALTLHYKQEVPVEELRAALEKEKVATHLIQYARGEQKLMLQFRENTGDRAENALKQAFPQAGFEHAGQDRIGSQVGKELQQRAILALGLGLLGILIYSALRFEWAYAVAATISQVHDVFVALCLVVLFGHELTLTLVGAFLTIAGYSINEKIVVFDRVRELLRSRQRQSLGELLNLSLNLTLARTLLTGGTTLISTIALVLFGGVVIHDFAVTMLIGILTGIYSSHLIAPAIVWWLENYTEKRKRKTAASPDAPVSVSA